jgi:hypothetical protein
MIDECSVFLAPVHDKFHRNQPWRQTEELPRDKKALLETPLSPHKRCAPAMSWSELLHMPMQCHNVMRRSYFLTHVIYIFLKGISLPENKLPMIQLAGCKEKWGSDA